MLVPERTSRSEATSGRRVGTRQIAQQNIFAPLAAGVNALAQTEREIELRLVEEQRARQQADLRKVLLEEKLRIDEDFQQRMRDPNQDPNGFADRLDEDYKAAHVAILDRYWEAGEMPQDILEDFSMQLGGVRDEYFGKGLQHQVSQLRAQALTASEELGVLASQIVQRDPDSYGEQVDLVRETIFNNPDLTDSERQAALDSAEAQLRQAGAKAFATTRPQDVFALLDPEGRYPQGGHAASSGSTSTGATYREGTYQSVAGDVAAELGLDAEEVAAVMSFETAGTFDPNIKGGDGGNYLGLIQFGPEERRRYGIKVGSSPEEWTTAIVSFMQDRGFKPGMGIMDFYSTILTGRPGRYDVQDSNGTSVRNAVPRILSDHKPKAAAWLGQAIEEVEVEASTATERPPENTNGLSEPAPEPFDPSNIVTGHPLLDALSGTERLQMLGWAREENSRKIAADKAAMDIRIKNITEEALNNGGEIGAEIPSDEEILRVYGPVAGPQVIAEIDQSVAVGKSVQEFRTLPSETIQARLDALKPTPGSETFATEQKIYEAAQRAAASLLEERENDPVAYVNKYVPEVRAAAGRSQAEYHAARDRALEMLGIEPDSVAPYSQATLDKMKDNYELMDPAAKRAFFQQEAGALGPRRMQQFLRSLEGTPAAEDGYIYSLMRTWPGYTRVFERVLAGREMMQQDPAKKVATQTAAIMFRGEAARAITSLDPNASRAINNAAVALYIQAGGPPSADEFDTKLYEESLALALGGSLPADMTDGRGEVDDYTILPPGVSESRFEAWFQNLVPNELTRMSVEGTQPFYADGRTEVLLSDIKDDGVFVMTRPGVYIIKMASDGRPLMTKSGRPFRVRIPRTITPNPASRLPGRSPSVF